MSRPQYKGVFPMDEKQKGTMNEIRIGSAVYQVERKFVGKVSKEELLVIKLTEHPPVAAHKEIDQWI